MRLFSFGKLFCDFLHKLQHRVEETTSTSVTKPAIMAVFYIDRIKFLYKKLTKIAS